ncbi:NAD(P)H-binding protein [Paraconexibacter sp.]|uniref:NAD(P)H-binding protein n=1 Tax=Paraconexibacter sp. TaxID=2949640 RepID=UPI003568CE4B
MPTRVLLTGVTGYVGGMLLPVLLEAGHEVRCLVRRPERADLPADVEVVKGDVLTGEGLAEALEGVDAAYYLVHSMGRGGGGGDFADRDKRAADTFGAAAARAGVERVIYLGGLEAGGADGASEHLRSRAETAEVLRRHVPGLVHVRAAMVIGRGSASFEILSHLARRLPVMLTPRWVETRSQPVAIADVTATLARLATWEDPPAEVELGGADILSYREMMGRFAAVAGRRPPSIVPVPVLTPRLSSYWVSLFTPVETGLVRPLVDGLSAEMIVRTPPPPGLNDTPMGFDDAVRAALAEPAATA